MLQLNQNTAKLIFVGLVVASDYILKVGLINILWDIFTFGGFGGDYCPLFPPIIRYLAFVFLMYCTVLKIIL